MSPQPTRRPATRTRNRLAAAILALTPLAYGGEPIKPALVTFPAQDGFTIFADLYRADNLPGPAPIVILLHMYNSDRSTWKPLAELLAAEGCIVLAPDLRGHGESATTTTRAQVEARDTAIFRDMQKDLRGAYDFLAARPDVDRTRFALVGASVGCSVALQYAAADPSVDAVVCLTPGMNYLGLQSEGDMRQLRGRRILLVATADEREAVDRLAPLASGTQKLIFEKGRAHGTTMFGQPYGVERAVLNFLGDALGRPGDPNQVVCISINSNIYHAPGSGWINEISRSNLRMLSSAAEAQARGLRAARSRGPRGGGRR